MALGIVPSLARPGGNATGINFFSFEVNTKRLGLIHKLCPRLIVSLSWSIQPMPPPPRLRQKRLRRPLVRLGWTSFSSTPAPLMRSTPPLPPFRVNDPMLSSRVTASSLAAACSFTLAMRERIPASFSTRVLVEAGLLMCYGADIVDTFRQVGVYTGSILKGARPADLPVLQSTNSNL